MRILVGSKNPTKVDAVKTVFQKFYSGVEVIGISVDSGVKDQPLTDETMSGAKNRSEELQKINKTENLDADFFIGIEGGIINFNGASFNSNIAYILHKSGKSSVGISPSFQLPKAFLTRLEDGEELGKIIDEIKRESGTGQKGGAIEFFTKGNFNRTQMTETAVLMALIPFIHEELFTSNSSHLLC